MSESFGKEAWQKRDTSKGEVLFSIITNLRPAIILRRALDQLEVAKENAAQGINKANDVLKKYAELATFLGRPIDSAAESRLSERKKRLASVINQLTIQIDEVEKSIHTEMVKSGLGGEFVRILDSIIVKIRNDSSKIIADNTAKVLDIFERAIDWWSVFRGKTTRLMALSKHAIHITPEFLRELIKDKPVILQEEILVEQEIKEIEHEGEMVKQKIELAKKIVESARKIKKRRKSADELEEENYQLKLDRLMLSIDNE